ncbi:MAG: GspH/FimT family pseudopilin [Gammaproteobacteria bacterium]|jgi:type IV fimbrial biogenesis protein FimT
MSQRGFTLWELLVTVLVIGVVLGIGVPNFSEFSRNSEMASAVNALVSAIHVSRTEAVKRGMPVTLCGSSTPLAAAPSCDGGSGGYFAFTDVQDTDADGNPDGNGVFDGADQILLQRDRPADQIVTAIEGASGRITFGTDGFRTQPMANPLTRVMYCDQRGNVTGAGSGGESVARVVVIAPTGRPQLLRDVAAVADFIADTGASCP